MRKLFLKEEKEKLFLNHKILSQNYYLVQLIQFTDEKMLRPRAEK